MKLKINPPTQAKPFARQIDFEQNQLVLHADTDIMLPYQGTELEVIFCLGIKADLFREDDKQAWYKSFVERLIFKFTTPQFTYQVEHAGTVKEFFDLLEEKHPFLKIITSFENQDLDPLRRRLAEVIAQSIEDYNKTGVVKKITNISGSQLSFPIQESPLMMSVSSQFDSSADSRYVPEEPKTYPFFNLVLSIGGIILAGAIAWYASLSKENALLLFVIAFCLGILCCYAGIMNIRELLRSLSNKSN